MKLGREDQSALVAAARDVPELLEDAWRQVAGKRAVAAFDEAH